MRRLLICLAVASGTASGSAAQACTPAVLDLGHPPGAFFSEVIAFGPHGEAGGGVLTDAGGRAVLWRDGRTLDLGSGEVSDINARGDTDLDGSQ